MLKYYNQSMLDFEEFSNAQAVEGHLARYYRKTFDSKWIKIPLKHIMNGKRTTDINTILKKRQCLGFDKVIVVDEPGRGRGLRLKTSCSEDEVLCFLGPKLVITKPAEYNMYMFEWPDDTEPLYSCPTDEECQFGEFVNHGIPLEVDGEAIPSNIYASLVVDGHGDKRIVIRSKCNLPSGTLLYLHYS